MGQRKKNNYYSLFTFFKRKKESNQNINGNANNTNSPNSSTEYRHLPEWVIGLLEDYRNQKTINTEREKIAIQLERLGLEKLLQENEKLSQIIKDLKKNLDSP